MNKKSSPSASSTASANNNGNNTNHLARIRDNQRRSRARRREYLAELETKFRHCEQVGVQASSEMQVAARRVLDENQRLRSILKAKGISEAELDGLTDNPNFSGGQLKGNSGTNDMEREARNGEPRAAETLQEMMNTRRSCCPDGDGNDCGDRSGSISSDTASQKTPAAGQRKSHEQQTRTSSMSTTSSQQSHQTQPTPPQPHLSYKTTSSFPSQTLTSYALPPSTTASSSWSAYPLTSQSQTSYIPTQTSPFCSSSPHLIQQQRQSERGDQQQHQQQQHTPSPLSYYSSLSGMDDTDTADPADLLPWDLQQHFMAGLDAQEDGEEGAMER